MRAAATLASLFVLALSSRAMAQEEKDKCATATSFTPKEMGECITKWAGTVVFPDKINESLLTFSAKDISELIQEIANLQNKLTTAKIEADAANKSTPDNDPQKSAKGAALASATKKAASASSFYNAAMDRRGATTTAFTNNKCEQNLVLCLDRDGQPYSNQEKNGSFPAAR